MDRYKLFTDKLVNMLVPTFTRGRKHILWIQSLLSPLNTVNDEFQEFRAEKAIEASVTSQVKYLEWYLNRRFGKYFVDSEASIKIVHYTDLGVPIFNDGDFGEIENYIWDESEESDWLAGPADEMPKPLYFEEESLTQIGANFKVVVPQANIPFDNLSKMMSAEIKKYALGGKTYIISLT